MQLGLVVGTATATARHPSLAGTKLLVVQVLASDDRTPDGEPVLAIDMLGAGRGDTVLITTDGKHLRETLGRDDTPARYSVIGIRNE